MAIKVPIPIGYASKVYARSLCRLGCPLELRSAGGWIMERTISGTVRRDAMGCYPIFACTNWKGISGDLERLRRELVAVSLVSDPFGDYDESLLRDVFPDLMRPFKQHYVVDLHSDWMGQLPESHRRNIRRAGKAVDVLQCERPGDWLNCWTGLYDNLIVRHSIRGPATFSHEGFSVMLGVPGLVAFRAEINGMTLGMILWIMQGKVGYYHLAAYSDDGYEARVSFALFSHSLKWLCGQGMDFACLGAGAGVDEKETGLNRFKSGWATGTRTAYLCGRVLNREAYNSITMAAGKTGVDYFPAYRQGEFG